METGFIVTFLAAGSLVAASIVGLVLNSKDYCVGENPQKSGPIKGMRITLYVFAALGTLFLILSLFRFARSGTLTVEKA